MSSFKIILKDVKNEAENFEDISKKLERHYDSINGIKGNLTNVLGSAYDSMNSTLSTVMEQIQKEQQSCMDINKNLEIIVQTYNDTEKSLIPNDTLKSIIELGIDAGGYFKDNFWSSLRDSVIEGSGNTVVRVGGLINVITATARSAHTTNGFVILNPNVIPTTSKMISIGSKVATAAKYGLPVIGGIIDFACMRADGQDVKDSLIKASAHVGIGLAGGKAGAAIGAAVGSVVPGAGNVVGAVVGFVAGVTITTVGSIAFDYVYDNRDEISEAVKEVGDNIVGTAKDIGKTMEKGAKAIIDGIGNAVSSTGKLWGTVFG